MNVELNIGGSRLLREPIEKAYADGRVGGAAEMVAEGLRQRFGDIPASLPQHCRRPMRQFSCRSCVHPSRPDPWPKLSGQA